jgi:hypothetical protein
MSYAHLHIKQIRHTRESEQSNLLHMAYSPDRPDPLNFEPKIHLSTHSCIVFPVKWEWQERLAENDSTAFR